MAEIGISFVVPVYNVESYLDRCVMSLCWQEGDDYEILLVDDGSTDESGRMCDTYAGQNSKIRVFHKANGGLSSARNYGMERAQGTYVVFVDSDDYVSAGMVRKLMDTAAAYPSADMIGFGGLEECGSRVESVRNTIPERTKVSSGYEYLLTGYQQRNMNVQVWLYMFRKDFLETNELHFREGILHEDVEFTPRVILKAGQIVEIPEIFYHYIVRENSISTGRRKDKNIQDLSSVLKEYCILAEQQAPELRRWMKNAILDSYLNMIQEFRMYQPEYRKYVDKKFLKGKAATSWNRLRVMLCTMSVRLYCMVNDGYKRLR